MRVKKFTIICLISFLNIIFGKDWPISSWEQDVTNDAWRRTSTHSDRSLEWLQLPVSIQRAYAIFTGQRLLIRIATQNSVYIVMPDFHSGKNNLNVPWLVEPYWLRQKCQLLDGTTVQGLFLSSYTNQKPLTSRDEQILAVVSLSSDDLLGQLQVQCFIQGEETKFPNRSLSFTELISTVSTSNPTSASTTYTPTISFSEETSTSKLQKMNCHVRLY